LVAQQCTAPNSRDKNAQLAKEAQHPPNLKMKLQIDPKNETAPQGGSKMLPQPTQANDLACPTSSTGDMLLA